MFLTFNNLVRHLVILIISFALLFPCVWLLNKSYFTTISKVNYWEQRQIVSLLTFIVKNTDEDKIKNDLLDSLSDINFFDIEIKYNDKIILKKSLKKYDLDPDSTAIYAVKNYTIVIAKRKYASFVDDYKNYIRTLFTEPSNLILHRSLVVLITHLTILLLLEIIMIVISVKYRLRMLTNSILANNQ